MNEAAFDPTGIFWLTYAVLIAGGLIMFGLASLGSHILRAAERLSEGLVAAEREKSRLILLDREDRRRDRP